MDTTFLSDSEVEGITGRTRRDAQVRALRYMGIEHRERPDGSVAILRSHVEQVLGVIPDPTRRAKEVEPDWSAM